MFDDQPRYGYADPVRLIRTIRNDGTFHGYRRGEVIVRRGRVGHVRNVGHLHQDKIVYEVHFVEEDLVVGALEQELIPAADPWIETAFETRDRVRPRIALGKGGEVVAPAGTRGEIIQVLPEPDGGSHYHVRFQSRTFLVPERVLELDEAACAASASGCSGCAIASGCGTQQVSLPNPITGEALS